MADLLAGAPKEWVQNDQLSPEVFAWVEKNSRANSPEYMKTLQSIQQFRQNPVLPGQTDPSGALAWDTRMGNQYVAEQQAKRLAKQQATEQLLAQHYNPATANQGVYRPLAIDTRMAETHPMPQSISNMFDIPGDVYNSVASRGRAALDSLEGVLAGNQGE